MTVSTTENRKSYAGNGVTSVFSFPYVFFADADLVVLKVKADGTFTKAVLGTDYTVSGAGNEAGGSVTMTSSPAAGTTLVIYRDPQLTQPQAFVDNDPLPAKSVSRGYDRLTVIAQRIRELVDRSFRLSDADTSGASPVLPVPTPNAFIGWNGAGNSLVNRTITDLITISAYGTAVADRFIGDGVKTDFTLTANPGALANTDVAIGGVVQTAGKDFTWDGDRKLSFVSAPAAPTIPGDTNIYVRYLRALPQGVFDLSAAPFTQTGAGAVTRTGLDKLRESASVFDFGAVGDGVADDTAALAKAIAACRTLYWGDSTKVFRVTSKLIFGTPNQRNEGAATLLFDGAATSRIGDVSANGVTFNGLTFSGNNKQPSCALVYVASGCDRPRFIRCTFRDVVGTLYGLNSLNQTYGLLVSPYGVTDFELDDCDFINLTKYNNGAYTPPAIGIGFIGGVCFMEDGFPVPAASQPNPSRGAIVRCRFNNIKTILQAGLSDNQVADYDDADAIRTYGAAGGAEELRVTIRDCDFVNVSKRAFKLRASGAKVDNCRVYADGLSYGMTVPIDIVHNTLLSNVSIYTTSALPVNTAAQMLVGGAAFNRLTRIDGLYVSHCQVGVNLIANTSSDTLENFEVRNAYFSQVSKLGIVQSAPVPATQNNLRFENVEITGRGNNARAIDIAAAVDGKAGVVIRNMKVVNADVSIAGVNHDIDGLQIEVNSSSFAGYSPTAYLLRLGSSGLGGYCRVSNITIDASGINSAFLGASRAPLAFFLSDGMRLRNLTVSVPEALNDAYQHVEFVGSDFAVDGYDYYGAGLTFAGTTQASQRWAIRNAVRHGSAACIREFIYTNNAATTDGLVENVADYRQTTKPSVSIVTGARFVVNNVSSKTSNATVVQHGGLAKVANANTF